MFILTNKAMYFSAVCILSAFTVIANIYVLSLVSFDTNLQKEMPKWVYFVIFCYIEYSE